jgi:hypothetical protein
MGNARGDWRIYPPQFTGILERVGRDGETLEVDCGSVGQALNFSMRLRSYCKAIRDAKVEDVGDLRMWAPLVCVKIKERNSPIVVALPQAESLTAELAEKMLANSKQ